MWKVDIDEAAGRTEKSRTAGSIKVGQTIRIGYYSQEIETSKEAGIAYMDPKMRVIDYIRDDSRICPDRGWTDQCICQCWSDFYFRRRHSTA